MLTPEEQKELEALESEFGGQQAHPTSDLSPEEQAELEALEVEGLEKPVVDEDKMAKVRGQIEQMKTEQPEMFTEEGKPAPVEVGPTAGEIAGRAILPVAKGISMGTADVAAGLGFGDLPAMGGEGRGALGTQPTEYGAERERIKEQYQESIPEGERQLGETLGAITSGVATGGTSTLAPVMAKTGKAGLAARAGLAGTESGAIELAETGDVEEAAKSAGIGAVASPLFEGVGAGASKLYEIARTSKAGREAASSIQDLKEKLTKQWAGQGEVGKEIVETAGPKGKEFRRSLAEGGVAEKEKTIGQELKALQEETKLLASEEKALKGQQSAFVADLKRGISEAGQRRQEEITSKLDDAIKKYDEEVKKNLEEVSAKKLGIEEKVRGKRKEVRGIPAARERALKSAVKAQYENLKKAVSASINTNKKKAESIYNDAYRVLARENPKELPKELTGINTKNLPLQMRATWKRAVQAKDAATQAKAVKQLRKDLYGLSTDQKAALFNANQDPGAALEYIKNLHGSYTGLGEGDKYYKMMRNTQDFVDRVGVKIDKRKEFLEESVAGIGRMSPSRAKAMAEAFPEVGEQVTKIPKELGEIRERFAGEAQKGRAEIEELGAQARSVKPADIERPTKAGIEAEVPFKGPEDEELVRSIQRGEEKLGEVSKKGLDLESDIAATRKRMEGLEPERAKEQRIGEALHTGEIPSRDRVAGDVAESAGEAAMFGGGAFAAARVLGKARNMIKLTGKLDDTVRRKPLEALRTLGEAEKRLEQLVSEGQISPEELAPHLKELEIMYRRLATGTGAAGASLNE